MGPSARFDQLNLIEGKRLTAMSHGRLYQRWVKNAFDKKVRLRKFNEGDLVLKKVSQAVKTIGESGLLTTKDLSS